MTYVAPGFLIYNSEPMNRQQFEEKFIKAKYVIPTLLGICIATFIITWYWIAPVLLK